MAASLPAVAHADYLPDDNSIVVTATRTEQPLSRIGQSISVLDASDIKTRQSDTLVDLVRDLPGVSFARNGGIGGVTSVFVRGANSDQTVVLVDGVKLNDPSSTGGGFFFDDLMTGNIDRIELLRGSQSVLWGSQAIGGVLNIITRQPTDHTAIDLRGEYGFRNTANVDGNISGKQGPISASIGGSYYRTDGISAFDENVGGQEKDGYSNYSANAKVGITLADNISLDLRGWFTQGRSGQDGFPAPFFTFGDTDNYALNREYVGYAGLNATLLEGRFHNRIAYAYTNVRRRLYSAPDTDPSSDYRGKNGRIEYQGIFDIADGWQATFGAERETQRFSKVQTFDPVGHRGSAHTSSAYGQLVGTPMPRLTLTGGVRYDHHSEFGGHAVFAASGVYSPNGGATTFRASYSEGFKAPSLYQLASEYGNPGLHPETSHGWDAGVTQKLVGGSFEVGATYFRRSTNNLIDFADCPGSPLCADGRFGYYLNVDKGFAQGAEATLTMRPNDRLTVTTSYTYVQSVDRSPNAADFDAQLLRRPRNSISTVIDYRWPFELETGATIRHVSSSRDTNFDVFPAEDVKLKGYVLVDLRASYPVFPGVELYGRIENLFDAKYETVLNYGTPGRGGYVGVRLSY
jgi:vitamin B12 transporter